MKGGAEGKLSPLQALFSPPGLQQMQQFLQQVANNNGSAGATAPSAGGNNNSGFNPAQLHHFMQQQQTFLNHHQVSLISFTQCGILVISLNFFLCRFLTNLDRFLRFDRLGPFSASQIIS